MSGHGEVVLWYRGGLVSVPYRGNNMTVMEWLHGTGHPGGVRNGCNRGECGSCTVAVGVLSGAQGQELRILPAVGCLLPLTALHGRALFTAADMPSAGDAHLHPLQAALAEGGSVQCGFCIPGILMSLWTVYESAPVAPPSRTELAARLGGNLCRCTGYRAVLAAADRAFGEPTAYLDRDPVLAALRTVPFPEPPVFRCESAEFAAPSSLAEAVDMYAERPAALLVAGGTDYAVEARREWKAASQVVWLGRVPELQEVTTAAGSLRIGAGVSLERAWAAVAARQPAAQHMWERFASPAIRHVGTIGGNLVTASPIGDWAPPLLAWDAEVEIASAVGVRRVPVENFFSGYRTTVLGPGEIVTAVVIPLHQLQRTFAAYKVSRRRDSDVSTVSCAFSFDLEGGRIRAVRLAFGGVADRPVRAMAAEAGLEGRRWDRAALVAAQQAVRGELCPIDDVRGGADYRRSVAEGLLERFWHATGVDAPDPTGPQDVWSLA